MEKEIIGGLIGAGGTLLLWLAKEIVKSYRSQRQLLHSIPKRTIRIVPRPASMNYRWHMDCRGGEVGMDVRANVMVTNITKTQITLVSAQMKKVSVLGSVMVKAIRPNARKSGDDVGQAVIEDVDSFGGHSIPENGMVEAEITFWIAPPIKNERESFVGSFALMDQFGNRHWLKNVKFEYDGTTRYSARTLTVLQDPAPSSNTWFMDKTLFSKPMMRVRGGFIITNIDPAFDVTVVSMKMKQPKVLGTVKVRKDSEGYDYGAYPIARGKTTNMTFEFLIDPPCKAQGETFVADIAVLDQFGNEHWLENVEFMYTGLPNK